MATGWRASGAESDNARLEDGVVGRRGRIGGDRVGHPDRRRCGGACGGDILFAETCRDRGVHLKIFLPFEEPEFLKSSVNFAGTDWERRYFDIRDHPGTETRILSGDLGCGPPDSNPFARNNMRQLYTAFAIGSGKVRFLCLWNRANGDGIGGTKHMYEVVAAQGGETCVLDTNELW